MALGLPEPVEADEPDGPEDPEEPEEPEEPGEPKELGGILLITCPVFDSFGAVHYPHQAWLGAEVGGGMGPYLAPDLLPDLLPDLAPDLLPEPGHNLSPVAAKFVPVFAKKVNWN